MKRLKQKKIRLSLCLYPECCWTNKITILSCQWQQQAALVDTL